MNQGGRRAVDKAVWSLCACQALLSAGLSLAFPFFAIYLHRDRGLPMVTVGAWLSASVFVTAFSQGLGGELSDAVGRRDVMAISLCLRAASILAMAAAIRYDWPFPVLIGLHMLSSFVAHFFEPAARSWIADHVEPKARPRAYSVLRTATNVGYSLGPAVGGLVAGQSYALLFALSAAACAACAAILALTVRDNPFAGGDEDFDLGALLRVSEDPRYLRLCLINLVVSVAMAQLVVPLSVFATSTGGITQAQMGLLFSLNGILVALFQLPASMVMGRHALTASLSAGCLAYAVGFGAVGWARGMLPLAAAMVVITVAEVLVPVSSHALAANMSPPRARGRYLGFFGLSRQMGSALGPVLGCAGIEALSGLWAPAHWLAVAAVASACAAAFAVLGRSLKAAEQGANAAGGAQDEPAPFWMDLMGGPILSTMKPETPPPMPKVCLIDDEIDFTELTGTLLSLQGYEVTSFNDPALGLAAIKAGGFDAVVVDLMMPTLDGFSIMRAIRKDSMTQAPVFALSAKKLSDEERRFILDHGVTFVQKPFEPRRLVELIRRTLKPPA